MNARGSYHRYVVMEALVAMCSGKQNLNLEEIGKKLVDVLVAVNYLLYRELNTPQQC